MPSPRITARSQRFGALAALLFAAGVAMIGSASAQEAEEDLTFEQKIIHKLLGGSSSDIEYRERSPLVIPPAAELPPPVTDSKLATSPAWPKDPDANRDRPSPRRVVRRGADDAFRESERALRPDELQQGRVARAPSREPANSVSVETEGRPLLPSEVSGGQDRQLHHLLPFFGKESQKSAEAAPTERPTRSRLTQPPTDYRMPAPNAPYAPPKESGTSWFRAMNPFDRGTCEAGAGC